MKMLRYLVLVGAVLSPFTAFADGDCSQLSIEMQQFANQLTSDNQKLFCGQMTDIQRAMAMQMASSMSPDQAVQKASGVKKSEDKMPPGCPVK